MLCLPLQEVTAESCEIAFLEWFLQGVGVCTYERRGKVYEKNLNYRNNYLKKVVSNQFSVVSKSKKKNLPFTATRKFTMKHMKGVKFFFVFLFSCFLFLVIPAKAGIHSFSVFFFLSFLEQI